MKPIVMFVTLKKIYALAFAVFRLSKSKHKADMSLAVIKGLNPTELHRCLFLVSVVCCQV
jgi:hypothetical protein